MNACEKPKVLHLITSLAQGGAQAVLAELVSRTCGEVEHTVVSLLNEMSYAEVLRKRGIHVATLHMKRGAVPRVPLAAILRILRNVSPDIVQTWMYHADLLGGSMARLAGCRRVIWGIRNLHVDAPLTRGISRACALLSRWVPTAIACCSSEAARAHQALGYRREKFRVIRNGCNLARFHPDSSARDRIRLELGVRQEETLLGMVARWDVQKDHPNLLQALSYLVAHGVAFRCALVGTNMSHDNAKLLATIQRLGLEKRTMLIGPRTDIPDIMNAFDIHVLSSASEAFPNVVAESMACGTPCVTTNVGDAALIVGNPEWVVPPHDPVALAQALEQSLERIRRNGREALGKLCRDRIAAHFSLERMVAEYRDLWNDVVRTPTERLL